MENTPPPTVSPSLDGRPCPLCRTPNPDWLTHCRHCGVALPEPDQAMQAESAHIAYLLAQLSWWRSRTLLAPEAEAKLQAEYAFRQERLRERFGTDRVSAPPDIFPAPPVVPDLPPPLVPTEAASLPLPFLPVSAAVPTPAAVSARSSASTSEPISTLQPPRRPTENARGIAVFLQEHALKIVFALATVLVLIALRSILGWNETSAAFLALTPLLPLGLTAMFRQFGRRTQQENPWAAFVYQGLSAVLVGFDLFILHRYWLTAAGLILPTRTVLFTACVLSTATCGFLWRRHRYPAMWHLFQSGLLVSLYSGLQGLKQIVWRQPDWRPTPLLLFGLAYLGMAVVYFTIAAVSRTRSLPDSPISASVGRASWILWANLSIGIAIFVSALGPAFARGLHSDDFLLVLLLAGALYGTMAQALQNARLVSVAAVLCLGSGLFWLPAHLPLGLGSYAALFLAFSTVALALYRFNRRRPAHRSLAVAWKWVALSGSALSLALTAGPTLFALVSVPPIGAPASALFLRAGLALLCGLQFLVASLQEADAPLAYPASLSGGIALLSLLGALHTDWERYPLVLVGYSAFLLLLSFRLHAAPRPQGQAATDAVKWSDVAGTCGRITLGISLLAGSALALVPGPGLWLPVSLLLGAVLSGILGSLEQTAVWRYAALYSAAYASGLFASRSFAAGSPTFTVCLLPFVLLCAGAAFAASLVRTGTDPDKGTLLLRQTKLWREPLADAGLSTIGVVVVAAWFRIAHGTPAPYLPLEASVCIVSALLLSTAHRSQTTDTRRRGALILLNAATALAIAGSVGVGAAGHPDAIAIWNKFVFGLLIQTWIYWLLARGLFFFSHSEAWSEDLARIEMVPAALVGLFTTIGLFWTASHSAAGPISPLIAIGSAFALVHVETLRSKQPALLTLSAALLLLAGLSAIIAPDPMLPYAALTTAVFFVLAAASFLQTARRLEISAIAWFTCLPLLEGVGLALFQFGIRSLGAQDIGLANAAWVLGGIGLTGGYLRTAKWSGQVGLVSLGGLTLIGAYLRAITWAFPLPPVWFALLLLPLLFGLAALSIRPPTGWEPFDRMLLNTTVAAAGIALLWTTLLGDGGRWPGAPQGSMPNIVTVTLTAYGIAFLLLAAIRKTPRSLAVGAAIVTFAYVNLLLSRTSVFSTEPSALSWPLFSFLLVQAALVWTGVGALLKWRANALPLASPVLTVAQVVALCSGVTAALSLHAPHQAVLAILTLAWAGGIWFGQWAMDQGEICLHIGTGNLLVAWCVTIYHTLGAETSLIDLYLLPFGLYLLVIGHQISRVNRQKEAQNFWWAGLLVTLTPAFLTRWMNVPGWHAALLLSECVVCVLWGIAQRIRVFVAAGLGTILVYLASVTLGTLPDTITTLLALVAGIGLFVFGFYAVTHQEAMKRLAAKMQQRWTVWHSWR